MPTTFQTSCLIQDELVRGPIVDDLVHTVNKRKITIERKFGRIDKVIIDNGWRKILCSLCNTYIHRYSRHLSMVHGVNINEARAQQSFFTSASKYLTELDIQSIHRPVQCLHCGTYSTKIKTHMENVHSHLNLDDGALLQNDVIMSCLQSDENVYSKLKNTTSSSSYLLVIPSTSVPNSSPDLLPSSFLTPTSPSPSVLPSSSLCIESPPLNPL